MKLILVGPTDEGFWHLENQHGMTWQIVERWGDHPGAAALFGWVAADGASDDERAEAAREFLMDKIGEETRKCRRAASQLIRNLPELKNFFRPLVAV